MDLVVRIPVERGIESHEFSDLQFQRNNRGVKEMRREVETDNTVECFYCTIQ